METDKDGFEQVKNRRNIRRNIFENGYEAMRSRGIVNSPLQATRVAAPAAADYNKGREQ